MVENRLMADIGEITNLLARRVIGEVSKKTFNGAVVARFTVQADKEILAKTREVVEGVELTEDIIEDYMATPQAMKQAILKAIGGDR